MVLDVRNVSKDFGRFRALSGVSLQVKEGEVYGFIGPNGAGKTTTIRTILGIYQASEGSVSIFGQDAWQDAVEIHRRIAYVPGDVSLWPNLTGGEVIDLFINLRGGKASDKRDVLIERFKLDPSKKCRTYSKGNRQKVALIAAFATDADLYIFDEPTSGLDPLMERVFHDCVMEVKRAGKSVLLSSHILSEVEKLCDRVAIIREGQIIENGTLDELRHLTRMNVKVKTKMPVSFEGISGVHQVDKIDDYTTFHVDASYLGEVISHLATFDVIDLQSSPPSLEELFMIHYQGETLQKEAGD